MRRIRQPGPGGWQGQSGRRQQAGEQRVGRPRVRQASATSATLTPEQRARQRALTETLRAEQAGRSARPGTGGSQRPCTSGSGRRRWPRPALRRTTGLVLAATGAIMWLGVRVHTPGLEIQTAGFILLVLGLVWLWLPLPAKGQLISRQVSRMLSYLEWRPAQRPGIRCALTDLLERPPDVRQGTSPPTEHGAE